MGRESAGKATGAGAKASGVEEVAVASPPTEDRFSTLWRRLKEHRIAQWSVGYVAVAYGIQHAVTLTGEAFDWPHEITRISMLLLVLGLPVIMALAWYHGEKANRRISGPEMTIIAILLAIGSLLFYVYVQPKSVTTAPAVIAAKVASASVPAKATIAPIPNVSRPSVAVLPFLNLSGDPNQEYFSDGMTEEITSALAKIPNLPVVGRTSAFAFKGKNEDMGAIAKALHATYLLEGSVRKDGNQVRITAQLIKAETGDHLWTDSYDRELKGIFAVQEDVAKAIAAAMQVPLGLKQGETLVSNRDIDPESYQNYLRAEALVRSRNPGRPLTAPIALLEQVVARQSNYAPAWALLAQAYSLMPVYDPVYRKGSLEQLHHLVEESRPKAEAAARRAIQLDPRNALAYTVLGALRYRGGSELDAAQLFQQALSFDPLNPDTLQQYSVFLGHTGRIKQAVAVREQLSSLDPLTPVFNTNAALIRSTAGDNATALAIAEALPSDYSNRAFDISEIYAEMGQYKNAADAILKAPRELYPPGTVEIAARLLDKAPTSATRESIRSLSNLSWVFAYVGFPERALEFEEHITDAGYQDPNFYIFWSSGYAAVRKNDHFKALVRKMGLVDYWRAKGWPDLCHPTIGDDFACN